MPEIDFWHSGKGSREAEFNWIIDTVEVRLDVKHLEDDGASFGELEIWKMCLVILMVCIILVYYIFINCAPPHIKRRHLIRPLADRYSLTSTSFFQEERKKYAREQSI
ncbi:hypothetical protein X801_07544 [Opisthorchis viverrini]|uniref:Uncharacterized protein n=1 Tax=Opisthorchis viverrini TaxID=6198 RepID=A0A1S8WQG0_OPIVI|nr:hypothetical protein X801_07544 [Opisthorchis viverrini]